MKKDNINLLDSYIKIEKKKSAKSESHVIYGALLLVIVLILGAYSIKLYFDNMSIQDDVSQTSEYVNSPTVLAKIRLIDEKQQKIDDLNKINASLEELNKGFAVIPRIDSYTLRLVTSSMPTNTSLQSVAFDGQWFTIILYSGSYSKQSTFAHNLENSGYFEKVNYYGYDSNGATPATKYVGKFMVALKVGN